LNSTREYILNGTSTQLGYTVPFTLVYAGKYVQDRRQILKNDRKYHKVNTTQKKKTQNTAKPKLAWFSRLIRHSARKLTRWAYFTTTTWTVSGMLRQTFK